MHNASPATQAGQKWSQSAAGIDGGGRDSAGRRTAQPATLRKGRRGDGGEGRTRRAGGQAKVCVVGMSGGGEDCAPRMTSQPLVTRAERRGDGGTIRTGSVGNTGSKGGLSWGRQPCSETPRLRAGSEGGSSVMEQKLQLPYSLEENCQRTLEARHGYVSGKNWRHHR